MQRSIQKAGSIKPSSFSGAWLLVASFLLGMPISANAQVTFEQKSNPAGLFTSSSATKNINDSISTITPSLSINEYSFTHWTLNDVRENAPDGQAKNKISSTITENTVAIAHYLATNQDSDSDGVPDWFEIRMFATLDHNGSYDGDGDGVSLAEERQFGLAATIADDFLEGGASIRRSGLVFANFGGAKKLSVSSDPAGLFTTSETFPETNSSYSSTNLNGLTNGYYFSHWEVNGVRQADSKGIGLSKISLTMNEDKTVVAKYYHQNEDTDSDGLPDWFEWHEFGTLDHNSSSDPDGDGLLMSEERQFGLSAVIADDFLEGGASIRRSGLVFANFGGAKKLSVSSDPAGLFTSSETFPETNSSYSSTNLNGLTNGYYFSHWEVNGVRQADSKGIGLSKISLTMNEDKTVVAKYYHQNEDSDSDGLPDWFEWHEFGTLDHNSSSDPDGDGLLMSEERQFGLSAVIADDFLEGGGSIRRSGTIGYIEFQPNEDDDGDGLTKAQELQYGTSDDNADSDGDGFPDGAEVAYGSSPTDANSIANGAPVDLNLSNNFSFMENLPIGSIIGDFNGSDPDGDQMTYFLISGLGDGNNSLFSLETNGSLKTATTFDFETNSSNYSIRVQAKDSYNQIYDANFTLTLLDDIHEDTDNDGYSDTIEQNQGTDSQASSDFPGTDYRNYDFTGFDANNPNTVDLRYGNFEGVNLNNKRLRANFEGANLRNASLTGNSSHGAKFIRANLTGANLVGRDFSGVNFTNANLTDANFTRAWFSSATIWPEGFDYLTSGAFGPGVDFRNLNLAVFDANNPNGTELTNANFDGVNLHNKRLRANFNGSSFRNATLTSGDSTGAKFVGADLSGANLVGRKFEGANFTDANLTDANFTRAWFSSATIWPDGFDSLNSGAFGPGVDFRNLNLSVFDANNPNGTELTNANFDGVNLHNKRLRANFNGSSFRNATLTGGDSTGAKFVGADLSGANLVGRKFEGANFTDANLTDANFTRTWFSSATIWPDGFNYLNSGAFGPGVDFRNLNLAVFDANNPNGTELTNANFDGVNLHNKRLRANFNGSSFRNATLTGGDSRDAKFIGADLIGANLSGRNLSNAVFTGALYSSDTVWPDGFDVEAAGLVLKRAPTDLNSTAILTISENQPVGTIIGEFNATDPDGDAITYHFVNGENNNFLFTLDTNGTLKTATTFDYESNASSYTITVQAKDELNATTEGNFTVTLLDMYEDTDGDGFRDSLEASTGSSLNDPTSTPLQQGLVAWYPFDGNASDLSGNGNHGTVNGATLGTDRHGVAGKAYSFDGVDDYIRVSNPSTEFRKEYTLSAWVSTTGNGGVIFSKYSWNTSSGRGFSLSLSDQAGSGAGNTGSTLYAVNIINEGWAPHDHPNYTLTANSFSHVLSVYSQGTSSLYVDNQLKSSKVYSHDEKDLNNSYDFLFGSYFQGGSSIANQKFKGAIDDFRIYNRALSVDEIEMLYRAESPNYFVDSAKDLEMIWVEPGTFTMGSPVTETDRAAERETQHQVTLTKGFYLGKYELTQAQYEVVMVGNDSNLSASPSNWPNNPNRPVETVSWDDIQVFLSRLNAQEATNIPAGWAYILPTEAEWEYVCRAGTTTAYSWGNNISASDANWNHGNDANQTEDVGQYAANPWGFFDMHGNVNEWVRDAYAAYSTGAQTDPFNEAGSFRVIRGGGWGNAGSGLRSARRPVNYPSGRSSFIGFRLALRDMNKAPTDLNSTAVLAVLENLPAGQVIGELNATDSDLNGSLRYKLVTGEGSEGNALFTLTAGGVLKSKSTFNYEADKNKSIRVAVLDDKNESMEKSFLVNILDMDEGTSPSKGAGTDADPLQIETLSHLNWLSHNSGAWTKSYILINDVNASETKDWAAGYGFNPIGNGSVRFKGKFNGNRKIIYGLTVNRPYLASVGLFGHLEQGQISNLGIKNGYVSGSTAVGGMAGTIQGSKIVNCFFEGNVTATGQKLGGLVGMSQVSSVIRSCYTAGKVAGTGSRIGGILGQNFTYSKVEDSYSLSRVVGYSSAGGLVGLNSPDTYVIRCFSAGPVTSQGLIGSNQSGFINHSFWDTQSSGKSTSSGGLAKTTAQLKDPETFMYIGWNFNLQSPRWKMIRGVTYPKLAWETLENISPSELNSTAQLEFTENLPVGSEIGSFVAKDLNYPSEVSFSLSPSSKNRQLFALDSNGTLKTATVFDYESNASSYTITVQAKDELNATTEGIFTVRLLNKNEPPYDFKNSADLRVKENEAVGTLVGQLTAKDPDLNSSLFFTLVDGAEDNNLFIIDTNGTLYTAAKFDFETNSSFQIRAKVRDKYNLWIKQNFIIKVLNVVEDNDQDGVEDHYDPDDDNDGFSDAEELTYGSDPLDSKSVANAPPVITLKDEYPEQVDKNGVFHIRTPENQKDIIQVTATDFDKDDLNFSIYGWQDLEHFEINASTGSLRFKLAPDFEKPSDHDTDNKFGIVLRVSDGRAHQDQPVYIHVDNQNEQPFDLNATAPLRIHENQPIRTIVGQLTAKDQDEGDYLIYRLVRDKEQIDNELFTLDDNGTLRTAATFDYEKNQTFHIRVKVTDQVELFEKESFYISVLNIVEDFDGDGTEDAYDEDMDGDGFSNKEEIAYGSNPLDSSSVINAAPTDITMQGGEIEENQPVGTLVARFFAVDADTNDTFSYQLIDSANKEAYPFKLSQRGGLRTTRKLDYESDAHDYSLTIRVMDDLNESFEKSFHVQLINQIEDLDGDGTEDAYDEDLDGDGFSNEQEREIGTSPTDRYSRPEKPILNSGIGRIDENGTIFLTGGIKANGGAEISDFGFVISSGISLDRRKSTVYWVRGNGEPKEFKLTVTESPFPKIFYFRTWARNVAGYGIGPARKVVIPEAPKPWWGEVEEGAGGWLKSDWFGTFKYYEQGWLYHARLGWLYSSPAKENSVWLWREDQGWFWTKEGVWPYLWSDHSGYWLYLVPGKPGEPIRFYDYSSDSYR